MTAFTCSLPLPGRDLLGEGPVWDDAGQALFWVDARNRRVQRWQPGQGTAVQAWDVPQEVGSIALTRAAGADTDAPATQLLLALADSFALLDLATGTVTPRAPVAHPNPPMRLNDGRCDREGRYVCGSLVLHKDGPDGVLYRLEHDGRLTTLLERAAEVSNATCFSPDGRTLYFADSLAGTIRAFDYAAEGGLSNARVLVDTRPDGSPPDGATVDAEGCLWVALVLSGQIARYAPDGRLLRRIDLPVPHPTCPSFGGPGLDTLFVTSIRDSGHRLKSDAPEAGGLVRIDGLGVRGLPEERYRVKNASA